MTFAQSQKFRELASSEDVSPDQLIDTFRTYKQVANTPAAGINPVTREAFDPNHRRVVEATHENMDSAGGTSSINELYRNA